MKSKINFFKDLKIWKESADVKISKMIISLRLILFLILLYSIFSILYSHPVNAATLSFSPASAEYAPGDVFIQEIRLDNEDEDINTVEVGISFDNNFLEAVDVNLGNSILPMIVDQPQIDQPSGSIYFSGIIPSGYLGRLPGDPGTVDLIGKIIFKISENIKEKITTKIEFDKKSQVFLNDGLGTKSNLKTARAEIKILADKEETINQWQEELASDKIKPELFQPEIARNENVFNNQWFVSFKAVDKQTGIAGYQIQENNKEQVKDLNGNDWLEATSPYLLKDQSLTSYLFIKAIDKAGNEKIIKLDPIKSSKISQMLLLIFV